MEEAFVAALLAAPALSDLVLTRIWWAQRPQGSALPAIVLHRIAGAGVGDVMDGHDGLHFALLQIDAWALTYAAAKTASRAVRAALASPTDARFEGHFITAERDDLDPAADGKPTLFRTSLDVRVWFLEP